MGPSPGEPCEWKVSRARYMQVPRSREPQWGTPMGPGGYACTAHRVYSKMLVRQWKLKWKKQGSKFYVAKAGRVKILWKLKYGGQNSIFFSWNPWSKFYVPWKGGSKFYIFSQCLEKGGSKPRSLPTNFTEGVPLPGKLLTCMKQGKYEGFDRWDRSSNLSQIGSKLSIFQPMWPWNMKDDLDKQ